jgi:quinone-modifying oxidoreductase subunit QmoA
MENAGPGNGKRKPILVIGGGIAGITAALEAAEAGCETILVEKSPSLGGRVARFNHYFPKMCPPSCGLEINYQRLKKNPRITVLTQAEVTGISGAPGAYEATIKIAPRYVTAGCTVCGACAQACPAEVPDEFNAGLTKTKAIHLPHAMAYPALYVVERGACPRGCHACEDACPDEAIKLHQEAEARTLAVSAVVVATGWAPYDVARLDNLGAGKFPNVVANVVLERLAAPAGPTEGKILRPSDGKEPRAVAFVQCAGSRDQNHLPYCSGVCCTASLKHAGYLRAQYPEAQITIFYIDVRTPGQLEEFAAGIKELGGIELVKGKVGKIEEDAATRDLLVTAEDVLNGTKMTRRFDLVVLAAGIVPQTSRLPATFATDEFGFITSQPGLFGAGCAKRPAEVSASIRDATGASLKALQVAVGAIHG